MKTWLEQLEFIEELISKKVGSKRKKPTVADVCKCLDVSRGKVRAWKEGQRPSADDLQAMAKILKLSPEWLLMQEGQPFGEKKPQPAKVDQILPLKVRGLAECSIAGWQEPAEMVFSVPKYLELSDRAFAVVAIGDSMIPAGIRAGMLCYCDPEREPNTGDAVYVEADGRATIKVWHEQNDSEFTELGGWIPGTAGKKGMIIKERAEHISLIAPVVYVRRRQ